MNDAPPRDEVAPGAQASRGALAARFDCDADPLRGTLRRRERVPDRARSAPHLNQRLHRVRKLWLLALSALVFSGCDSEASGPADRSPGAYVLSDSVNLRFSGRTGETINAGDFFSDTTLVWSGDQLAGDGAGAGDVRVTLPVHIEVTDGADLTLNIEDIFGDNTFTWQRLELLDGEARRVGGAFEVIMPVVIRVSGSQGVQINLEDIFGDNTFTWTVGTPAGADATREVGRIGGGVGGPFSLNVSVTIEVMDSRDVGIDIEDVVNDSQFAWAGGDQGAAAFVGGSMRFEVPLTFRVERSERVRINLEDTAGDMTLDWSVGASEGIGGPIRFDVPTSFHVAESRDVNIDFEDQGSDNIFTWTVDGQGADAPELSSSVAALTPAAFRVMDGEQVVINSEDFFGDNVFVWTAPFAPDARAGLDGAVSASASTTFRVEISEGVNIDAEDVYGDNLFAWDPLDLDQPTPLRASVHEVVGGLSREVVESDSVTIEFANLNQGNQYLWGPPPELDR